VLLSKSSIIIDTAFTVEPGSLGGFPGGYSIYRDKDYRLISVCDNKRNGRRRHLNFSWKCVGDHPLTENSSNLRSNNVNGPGSPSVRYYSFM